MYVLVCDSESESVSVSVLSLMWWQAQIARLQSLETTSKAAGAAATAAAKALPKAAATPAGHPPPPPPTTLIAEQPILVEREEEEEDPDEDEEVDEAMDLARAVMAEGLQRAASALKMKNHNTHIQQFTSCTGGLFIKSLLQFCLLSCDRCCSIEEEEVDKEAKAS